MKGPSPARERPEPLPFPEPLPDLPAALSRLLEQIPWGRVTTYGDLARALGDPHARAARWVGEYLKHHDHDALCVCHRVVRVTGELGGYVLNPESLKSDRLLQEGVQFLENGRVDLQDCRFQDFEGDRPLARLIELQAQWAGCVRLTPSTLTPRLLAGLDIAYPERGLACGVGVLLDATTLAVTQQFAVRLPITFPYIPGFLGFRELPVLLELWKQIEFAGIRPDVVFIDGNGILHPRRAGIAASFGVLTGVPTIGVGKSLLCGRYDRAQLLPDAPQPIVDGTDVIGFAMQATAGSKPVFISPGSQISLQEALRLTRAAINDHVLPEPIHQADRRTKQHCRNQPPTPSKSPRAE